MRNIHTIIFTNLTCFLECSELIGSFVISTKLLAVPLFPPLLEIITDYVDLTWPDMSGKLTVFEDSIFGRKGLKRF